MHSEQLTFRIKLEQCTETDPYLSIHQELAVQLLLSSARIPSEEHTSTRSVPHVAEHHGLHVHSSASQASDPVNAPVLVGPGAVPRVEHSQHCQLKLLLGVCRTSKGKSCMSSVQRNSFSFKSDNFSRPADRYYLVSNQTPYRYYRVRVR